MSLAETAEKAFNETGIVPDLGQAVRHGIGGDVHVFPDGSLGMYCSLDDSFGVAEVVE